MTPDYQSGANAMRRVRHKKRGSTYRVIAGGIMQTTEPLPDNHAVVVYQSETDGEVWVRPAFEFEDGRFENLPPLPVDPTSDALSPALTKSAVEFASLLAADADKPVADIAKLPRECMDDLGVTPRRIDADLGSSEGADTEARRIAQKMCGMNEPDSRVIGAVLAARDAEIATLQKDATYWTNKCEEALKRSGENKARADAAEDENATLRRERDDALNQLDAVVHALDIEDSTKTPVERVDELYENIKEINLMSIDLRAEIVTLRAALEKIADTSNWSTDQKVRIAVDALANLKAPTP